MKMRLKIKASHLDWINENFYYYASKSVKNVAAPTLLEPYKKPMLINHDEETAPLGRIVDYYFGKGSKPGEPAKFLGTVVEISDPEAQQKVIDGRYNPVSIGSRPERVMCSECNTIINEEGLCDHVKGSLNNKGKPIYWIIDVKQYKELSFVNVPADPFAGIEAIDLGEGWQKYDDFLACRDSLTNDFNLEDSLMKNKRLTAEARAKLSDSSFAGPGKTFPAINKEHIEASIQCVDAAGFSEETTKKIKSALYRKGQRFDITVDAKILENDPDFLSYRVEDNFSEDEIKIISDYFTSNIDMDLPKIADSESDTPITEPIVESETTATDPVEQTDYVKEISELKEKNSILETKIQDLLQEISDKDTQISAKVVEIEEFKSEISNKDTILNSREDEINRYLDKCAIFEKKYKDSLIDKIIYLSSIEDDKKDELITSLSSKSIDVLIDKISDIKDSTRISNTDNTVKDPTIIDTTDTQTIDSVVIEMQDKFAIFKQERFTEDN